jgi:hypothetical protein
MSERSNRAMESTATRRYNLIFLNPDAYHVAMCASRSRRLILFPLGGNPGTTA